jgi:outer membrane protein insertion porin family
MISVRPATLISRASFPCFLLLAVLFLPPGAGAEESDDLAAYDGWPVQSLRVEGVPKRLASSLRNGLALRTETKLLKKERAPFSAKQLQEDLERIRLFLARRGYPSARVTPVVEAVSSTTVSVTYQVELGPPVLVGEVRLERAPHAHVAALRSTLTLRSGAVLTDEEVDENLAALLQRLKEESYASAEVKAILEESGPDRVDVVFRILATSPDVFGTSSVTGVPPDLARLAEKSMGIRPGQPYTPKAIEQAEENLRFLNLFSKIRITTTQADEDTLNVEAELALLDPRTVQTSAGWWTNDGVRVGASWTHRNLFSKGRGLLVGGSYTQFLQTGKVSTWWPALLGPTTKEVLSFRVENQNEEAFDQLEVGVDFVTWFRPTPHTTYRISILPAYVKLTQDIPGAFDGNGWVTTLEGASTWDLTNDRINPTRGRVTFLRAAWAPPGVSEATYVLGETGTSVYVPWRSTVLAVRGVVGLARPTSGDTKLLPGRRFFLGGANTNRGFERNMLGPLDDANQPVGGQASLLFNVEERFPIVWILRGAVFLDVGQVWTETSAIRLETLQPSGGGSLMFQTPVGPVRFDLGVRLTDPGDQPRTVFHFMIGNPY